MKSIIYSRKIYKSRGKRPNRDVLNEAYRHTKECVICGETFMRKVYESGVVELWSRFEKRKSCSLECFRKWQKIPANNPRYKGIDPHCKDCGIKVGYKPDGKGGVDRCRECYIKKYTEDGVFVKRAGSLNERGLGFKKGRISTNGFKKGHVFGGSQKGKTYEEMYGDEKAKQLKEEISNRLKGKPLKEKLDWECIVCGKKDKLSPYYAKKRKTCSLSCNGKIKTLNKTSS